MCVWGLWSRAFSDTIVSPKIPTLQFLPDVHKYECIALASDSWLSVVCSERLLSFFKPFFGLAFFLFLYTICGFSINWWASNLTFYGELFSCVVSIRESYIFLANAWFCRNNCHFSARQLLAHVLVQEIQLKISQTIKSQCCVRVFLQIWSPAEILGGWDIPLIIFVLYLLRKVWATVECFFLNLVFLFSFSKL